MLTDEERIARLEYVIASLIMRLPEQVLKTEEMVDLLHKLSGTPPPEAIEIQR
jgi:hypothetical protein